MCDTNIIAYFSLDDFINFVVPTDGNVRVQAIRRTKNDMIQWVVVITSLTYDGIALISILVGEVWKFVVPDEPWHQDNVDKAIELVGEYLNPFFTIAPGVWNPESTLDNLVYGTAGLWHFEDHRLVANELVTDGDLAEADQPPDGQQG